MWYNINNRILFGIKERGIIMEEMFDKIKVHAEKAKDGAVKITKTVIDKTNNVVNQTKIKFAISEIRGKIKDIYTEIGKTVYENYIETGDAAENITEKCVKIDALNEEMTELKERLAELKETVRCPVCDSYNHTDDVYCSKCGEKLYTETPQEEDNEENTVTINTKKPEVLED